MKKKTKLVAYLLVMCLMVSMIPDNIAAAKNIRLSRKSLTLLKGVSQTIKLRGTSKKPKWSSSNKSVATVIKRGTSATIKAKKRGTAVITAKLGKKKYKCKVKVITEVPYNSYTSPSDKTTVNQTSKPAIVPTSAPTVENDYRKLADYLVKNGQYSSDEGHYYIDDITTADSADYYNSITYKLDGSYEFAVMSITDSSYELVILTITPPEYTKGAVANIFVQSSDTSNYIYANGEVVLSTLTKTDQSVTYTSTNAPTESIKESLYELGEKALAYGLTSWNDMIEKANLGLSLKDLGFTSY